MKKLEKKDIKILGEGAQLKKAILEKYSSIEEFYNKNNIPVSLNSYKTYLSRSKIFSDTFKCSLTQALNRDYNSIVKTKKRQIKDLVSYISINIHHYKTEKDFLTLEKLFELCREMEMSLERVLMCRAKARNYYYRNNTHKTIELYKYAIKEISKYERSENVLLHSELADIYFRQSMVTKAQEQYKIAKYYIEQFNIKNQDKHVYYYYKGIMYINMNKLELARQYFENAVKFSVNNVDKAVSLSNIGLTYKKEKMYQKALKYYNEGLYCIDKDEKSIVSSIRNNIAEVYRVIGECDKAKKYLDYEVALSENNNIFSNYLLQISTYIQIQVQQDNYSQCDKYFETLLKTRKKELDKVSIINSIKDITQIMNNKTTLFKLSDIIRKLIKETGNEYYKKELYECLGLVHERIMNIGGVICTGI